MRVRPCFVCEGNTYVQRTIEPDSTEMLSGGSWRVQRRGDLSLLDREDGWDVVDSQAGKTSKFEDEVQSVIYET